MNHYFKINSFCLFYEKNSKYFVLNFFSPNIYCINSFLILDVKLSVETFCQNVALFLKSY